MLLFVSVQIKVGGDETRNTEKYGRPKHESGKNAEFPFTGLPRFTSTVRAKIYNIHNFIKVKLKKYIFLKILRINGKSVFFLTRRLFSVSFFLLRKYRFFLTNPSHASILSQDDPNRTALKTDKEPSAP